MFVRVQYTAKCIEEVTRSYRILQIDFSADVDRVNHKGIIYKLCSVGYLRFCVVYIDTFFYKI